MAGADGCANGGAGPDAGDSWGFEGGAAGGSASARFMGLTGPAVAGLAGAAVGGLAGKVILGFAGAAFVGLAGTVVVGLAGAVIAGLAGAVIAGLPGTLAPLADDRGLAGPDADAGARVAAFPSRGRPETATVTGTPEPPRMAPGTEEVGSSTATFEPAAGEARSSAAAISVAPRRRFIMRNAAAPTAAIGRTRPRGRSTDIGTLMLAEADCVETPPYSADTLQLVPPRSPGAV